MRVAVVLIGATLLYNLFEGAASIYLGIQAGSLTLITFGADSYLEVLAAGAVLWRLSYQDEEAGERFVREASSHLAGTGWVNMLKPTSR